MPPSRRSSWISPSLRAVSARLLAIRRWTGRRPLKVDIKVAQIMPTPRRQCPSLFDASPKVPSPGRSDLPGAAPHVYRKKRNAERARRRGSLLAPSPNTLARAWFW